MSLPVPRRISIALGVADLAAWKPIEAAANRGRGATLGLVAR